MPTTILAIDVNESDACVAYLDENGRPVVISNQDNELRTPSVVLFLADGLDVHLIVGKAAKECVDSNVDAVAMRFQRYLGNSGYQFQFGHHRLSAEELTAAVLTRVVQDAEVCLGEKVSEVVLTCPAWFTKQKRVALHQAGEIAGLNVLRVFDRPTAAVRGYGLDPRGDEVVLVYELLDTGFETSVLKVEAGEVTVLAVGGDRELGASEWDELTVQFAAERFREQSRCQTDIRDDPETYRDLRLQAEHARRLLYSRDKAQFVVQHDGERARVELTRAQFEEMTRELLERTIQICHEDFVTHKLDPLACDKVLLVGEPTRMPQIAARLAAEFGIACEIQDPGVVVAKGAAELARTLATNRETRHELRVDEGVTSHFEEVDDAFAKVQREFALLQESFGRKHRSTILTKSRARSGPTTGRTHEQYATFTWQNPRICGTQ